jgi:hypothetical protein
MKSKKNVACGAQGGVPTIVVVVAPGHTLGHWSGMVWEAQTTNAKEAPMNACMAMETCFMGGLRSSSRADFGDAHME